MKLPRDFSIKKIKKFHLQFRAEYRNKFNTFTNLGRWGKDYNNLQKFHYVVQFYWPDDNLRCKYLWHCERCTQSSVFFRQFLVAAEANQMEDATWWIEDSAIVQCSWYFPKNMTVFLGRLGVFLTKESHPKYLFYTNDKTPISYLLRNELATKFMSIHLLTIVSTFGASSIRRKNI